MAAAGRKTKLTPEMTEKLCEALKNGNTRRASCQYAGISEDSFARYLAASAEFAEAVTHAEADIETRMVGVVTRAAEEGQYLSAQWWLVHHPRTRSEWKKASELDLRQLTIPQLLELLGVGQRGIESPGDQAALATSE